jgi:hypothetical protein
VKNPFRAPIPPTRETLLQNGIERLEKEKLQALSALLDAESALDLIRRKITAFRHELHLLQGTASPFIEESPEPSNKFPDIPH